MNSYSLCYQTVFGINISFIALYYFALLDMDEKKSLTGLISVRTFSSNGNYFSVKLLFLNYDT